MKKKTIEETLKEYFEKGGEINLFTTEHGCVIDLFTYVIEVESIWRDIREGEDTYYIHVGCPEFEGDLKVSSLEEENQKAIQECLEKNMEAMAKENDFKKNYPRELHYVDEIILTPEMEDENILGISFETGEYPVNMDFYDGFAIEVDEKGNHLSTNPLIMTYPTVEQVKRHQELFEEVKELKIGAYPEYTEKDLVPFDIAMTFGFTRRQKEVI
nr:hypothetical protein [Clostridia bacterium]